MAIARAMVAINTAASCSRIGLMNSRYEISPNMVVSRIEADLIIPESVPVWVPGQN